MPSSIGISVLVEAGAPSLRATVRWGDYPPEPEGDAGDTEDGNRPRRWRGEPREAVVEVPLGPGRP